MDTSGWFRGPSDSGGKGGPNTRAAQAMALVAAQVSREQVISFSPRSGPIREAQLPMERVSREYESRTTERSAFHHWRLVSCDCRRTPSFPRSLACPSPMTALGPRLSPTLLRARHRSPASTTRLLAPSGPPLQSCSFSCFGSTTLPPAALLRCPLQSRQSTVVHRCGSALVGRWAPLLPRRASQWRRASEAEQASLLGWI